MAKNKSAGDTTPASDYELVVIHPFGDRRRGDHIVDPDEIASVRAGENAHHCHKVYPVAKPEAETLTPQ